MLSLVADMKSRKYVSLKQEHIVTLVFQLYWRDSTEYSSEPKNANSSFILIAFSLSRWVISANSECIVDSMMKTDG